MKRPSFQFYPGDWLRDTALRSVSVGARGMWIDMIALMHEGNPYGHLKVGEKVILPPNLARIIGATLEETEGWLNELRVAGVFSEKDDGCIFSRRMVRDEEIRVKRSAGGALGGNPKLLKKPKVKPKVNHEVDDKDKQNANLQPTPSSSSSSSSSSAIPIGADDAAPEGDSGEPAKERPRNLVWDAICELFALDPSGMTEAEKSKIGKVVKQIKAACPDVTRDEIRLRAAEYRKRFPKASFTPTALLSHWSSLAQQELPQAKSEAWRVKNIYDCTR